MGDILVLTNSARSNMDLLVNNAQLNPRKSDGKIHGVMHTTVDQGWIMARDELQTGWPLRCKSGQPIL